MFTKSLFWLPLLLVATASLSAQTRLRVDLRIGDRHAERAEWEGRSQCEQRDAYDAPYRDVCSIREAGMAEEDIPVILFIYRHSHYPLRHILNLRSRGATWVELSTWCGIPQDLYYQPDGVAGYGGPAYGYSPRRGGGPPFGNAYGYYKHRGRPATRGNACLTDEQIVRAARGSSLNDRDEQYRSFYGDQYHDERGRGRHRDFESGDN